MRPVLHLPRHPLRAAAVRAAGGGAGLDPGAALLGRRGPGAVRRRRRPRVPAAGDADELVRRHGADLRLPPLRLAGRARRLAGDHRRAGGRRAPRTAARSRPGARVRLARRAARRRRGAARPRAGRRRGRSPATGFPAAWRGPTAATATARAPSRSTWPSRAACRGPPSPPAAPAPCTRSGSFEEIGDAERDVNRGRMPERPFVLVGQQYLADPSRSNGDVHPVWAYAHVPSGYDGDATEAVIDQIERFAPGLRERIVGRFVRSTAELERLQPQLRGRRHHHRRQHGPPDPVPPAAGARPLRDRHPRRLHLLGRDAARRRRARDERLQRRDAGPAGTSAEPHGRPAS